MRRVVRVSQVSPFNSRVGEKWLVGGVGGQLRPRLCLSPRASAAGSAMYLVLRIGAFRFGKEFNDDHQV